MARAFGQSRGERKWGEVDLELRIELVQLSVELVGQEADHVVGVSSVVDVFNKDDVGGIVILVRVLQNGVFHVAKVTGNAVNGVVEDGECPGALVWVEEGEGFEEQRGCNDVGQSARDESQFFRFSDVRDGIRVHIHKVIHDFQRLPGEDNRQRQRSAKIARYRFAALPRSAVFSSPVSDRSRRAKSGSSRARWRLFEGNWMLFMSSWGRCKIKSNNPRTIQKIALVFVIYQGNFALIGNTFFLEHF